jgi:hypothetical protein
LAYDDDDEEELTDPDDVSSAAVVSADSTVTQTQVMIPRSIPICAAPLSWCLKY